MTKAPELLPCPFCSAKMIHGPIIVSGWAFICGGCGTAVTVQAPDKERAIAAWNTRADTITPPDVVEKMREALEAAKDGYERATSPAESTFTLGLILSALAALEESK